MKGLGDERTAAKLLATVLSVYRVEAAAFIVDIYYLAACIFPGRTSKERYRFTGTVE